MKITKEFPSAMDVVVTEQKPESKRIWVSLLILTLIATTVTFAILWAKSNINDQMGMVCMTPACVSAAARLMKSMNLTVDPCDDFYEFACGNWNQSEPMPSESGSWSTFSVLRKELLKNLKVDLTVDPAEPSPIGPLNAVEKARKYFSTCVDSDAIRNTSLSALIRHLEVYGPFLQKWPFRNEENLPDLFTLMKKGRQYGNVLGLYHNFLMTNTTSPRKTVINFASPDLTMDRFSYINESRAVARNAYVDYGKSVVLELQKKLPGNFGNFSNQEATQLFEEILAFETELMHNTLKPEEQRNETAMQNHRTLAEFASEFSMPYIAVEQWLEYFQGAWPIATWQITKFTVVNVREPLYYSALRQSLIGQLNTTTGKSRFLANYFGWKIIEPLIGRLDEDFLTLSARFSNAQTGTTADGAKWMKCINIINGQHLPNAVGSLYLQKHFRRELKDELNIMIDYLLEAFKTIIKEADWMTPATRAKALTKVSKITRLIGFDDYLMDNITRLNDEYKNFVAADTYLENFVNGQKFVTEVEGRKYLLGSTRTDWHKVSPATVNAMHIISLNSIMFPAGVLQPPFIGDGIPQYLNFAAIGFFIGHELTHGFDDKGSTYDGDGVLGEPGWWDAESRNNFKLRAQGIIDQYSRYSYLGFKLNSFNNQGENIADNGGLKEAYKAYKLYLKEKLGNRNEPSLPGFANYTTDQMFYLSYAQVWCGDYRKKEMELQLNRPHPPSRLRVIGPLQNSKNFASAYNCHAGTNMNPATKYAVW